MIAYKIITVRHRAEYLIFANNVAEAVDKFNKYVKIHSAEDYIKTLERLKEEVIT